MLFGPLHGGAALRALRRTLAIAVRLHRLVATCRRRVRRVARAIEGHLVLAIAAPHQTHAVIIGKAIDSWAHLMHCVEVSRLHNGPGVARLRCHRWRGTAIRHNVLVIARAALGQLVVPLRVNELEAGAIAPCRFARVRADGLEADIAHTLQELRCRALVDREAGAVDDGDLLVSCSAGASLHLQLEWQGPAIHQAHVHGVTANHLTGHRRIAGKAFTTESGLKLGINRRGTQ
mmetsp:Transcript_85862/g.199601  ORF Transcript_85862/g.199601 Transcript_85862/m.199601 type:complete len:233 (+) Transcript_85862:339-1037(+)